MHLDTTPGIFAVIKYGKNSESTENMTLDEINECDKFFKVSNLVDGKIDDTVACIATVEIHIEDILRYLFGDHFKINIKTNKKTNEEKHSYRFIYNNQYIPLDIYRSYQASIGLKCNGFKIGFKVKDSNAIKYLQVFDTYNPDNNSFGFSYQFPKGEDFDEDTLSTINDNITVFLNEATQYCRREDIEVGVQFNYTVKTRKILDLKFKEAKLYANNHTDFSFNEFNGKIGIDFDWRQNDLESKIKDFEDSVKFVTISLHENHKYKCSVHANFKGFDVLEDKLKESFTTNISVENDSLNQSIKIKISYTDSRYYESMRTILKEELSIYESMGFNVTVSKKVEGKIRLELAYDQTSKLEDIEDSISDMKKADFGIQLGEKDIKFGNLLYSNYPELTFDIDVDNDENKALIEDAFKSKSISVIIPILTGDLEKVSRLKKTYLQAVNGEDLINNNLQNFITSVY